jgi:hypothetical protein
MSVFSAILSGFVKIYGISIRVYDIFRCRNHSSAYGRHISGRGNQFFGHASHISDHENDISGKSNARATMHVKSRTVSVNLPVMEMLLACKDIVRKQESMRLHISFFGPKWV